MTLKLRLDQKIFLGHRPSPPSPRELQAGRIFGAANIRSGGVTNVREP